MLSVPRKILGLRGLAGALLGASVRRRHTRPTPTAPIAAVPPGAPAVVEDRGLAHARLFARVLDDYYVDPLLGMFLPGIGDVLGSVIGLYVVGLAVRRRVSPLVIARMLMNLVADAVLGVVPIIGDAIDFKFKANRRNVELLADRSAVGGRARASDWLAVGAAVAAFLAVIALVCWGVIALVRAL